MTADKKKKAANATYRLPDGQLTQDHTAYVGAWEELAAPLKDLGWEIIACDPDFLFRRKQQSALRLPLEVVRMLVELIALRKAGQDRPRELMEVWWERRLGPAKDEPWTYPNGVTSYDDEDYARSKVQRQFGKLFRITRYRRSRMKSAENPSAAKGTGGSHVRTNAPAGEIVGEAKQGKAAPEKRNQPMAPQDVERERGERTNEEELQRLGVAIKILRDFFWETGEW